MTIKPPDQAEAWAKAIALAATLYNQAELHVWLHTPQPLLANITPLQCLGTGKGEELLRILQNLD